MNFSEVKEITIPEGEVKKITIGDVVVWEKEEPQPAFEGLTFTAEEANSEVKFIKSSSTGIAWDIEYSTDGITWTEATALTTSITLTNVGDKVYFRGLVTNAKQQATAIFNHFEIVTGKVAGSGNVMSIMGDATELTVNYQFVSLFKNCSALTTAPQLPATTLSESCYYEMFKGCSSLRVAPELPATTLTNYCYYSMFSGCSALVSTPALPATTLKSNCYYFMFGNCTALATITSLPATTLALSCCAYMFSGCSALTTVPDLVARSREEKCYQAMFRNCTSLTKSPYIRLTRLSSNSISSMFYGCSCLNEIKVDFTTGLSVSNSNSWVGGVAETGTFYFNGTISTRGVDTIPSGWSVVPF